MKAPKPSKYIVKLFDLKSNTCLIEVGNSLAEARNSMWNKINSSGFNTENYSSLANWVYMNTKMSTNWKIQFQYQWDSSVDQLEFFLTA